MTRENAILDFDDVEGRIGDFVLFMKDSQTDLDREFKYLASKCQKMPEEEKLFFILLATHFDNPDTAIDFYRELNWKGLHKRSQEEISEICDGFFHEKRRIGSHRKYFRCLPREGTKQRNKISYTVQILESYRKAINTHHSQANFFEINNKPKFDHLYQKMKEISHFHTRLPRFDHLERISRTHDFYVLPERFYAEDSTGPLDGLTYLFFGQRYRKRKKKLKSFLTGNLPTDWNAHVNKEYRIPYRSSFKTVIQTLERWTIVNVKRLLPQKQQINPAYVFDLESSLCNWQKGK